MDGFTRGCSRFGLSVEQTPGLLPLGVYDGRRFGRLRLLLGGVGLIALNLFCDLLNGFGRFRGLFGGYRRGFDFRNVPT